MTIPTHAILMESATLAAAAYDDRRALLQLQFQDGTCYQYTGVSTSVFRQLLSADSKGSFFNRSIRDSFPYVRLKRCALI